MPDNQDPSVNSQVSGGDIQGPARPKHGGRRPGAGRRRGSKDKIPRIPPDRKASFRERFEEAAVKNWDRVVDALVEAAARGDTRAGVEFFNRVLGPSTQKVELSGPGGTPIALQAAAPIALAMMSTDELRALVAFHKRIGLPDVEGRAVESGPTPPLSLPSPLDIDDSAAGGPPAPQAPGTDPDDSAAPNSTIQADNPAPIAPESPQASPDTDPHQPAIPDPIDAQTASQTPADGTEQGG